MLGSRDNDFIVHVVRFTSIYAISVLSPQKNVSVITSHDKLYILDTTFCREVCVVSGFLCVLCFSPPVKLTATI